MTNKVYPEYNNAVNETGAQPYDRTGLYAEATLYDLLKEQLPPEWGFLWGLQLGEHEYDFLILVPGRGLVNMECKGGGYSFCPDYQFEIFDQQKQQTEKKDLLGQATGAAQYYKKYLQRALFRNERYEFGLMGRCVVFPITTYEDDFRRLELPVYDKTDRERFAYNQKTGLTAIVEKSLDDAENFLRNRNVWNPAQLSEADAQKIWSFWMSPPQRPFQTRHYKIKLENFRQQMVNFLNPLQANILNTISNPEKYNFLITGAAGTGKSVLAQAAAANLPGCKLYVCFNKVLACCTRLSLPAIPDLAISHFHKLDELLLGEQIRIPQQNGDMDWAAIEQEMLDRARKSTLKKYDSIIVDEAQDLTEIQLRFLLRFRKNKGKIILFSSTEQQIYPNRLSNDRLKELLANLEICRLDVNLRNTRQIDSYCQQFLENQNVTANLQGPDVVERALKKDKIPNFLAAEVAPSFSPYEVAVLSPERALLDAVHSVNGVSFYSPDETNLRKTENNLKAWRQAGRAFWKSTTHSFKGLESMVIVHLIPEDCAAVEKMKYLGGSRAVYKLYVVTVTE